MRLRPLPNRRTLLLGLLAALALAGLPAAGHAQKVEVTFLHVNDVYEISPKQGIGGMAPLMTLLRQERARTPHTLTTLGGDTLGSSMMSGITKGAQMIELWNAIGLDIAVVGNHEFDFGPDVFRSRLGESRFPWLGTNALGQDGKPFGGMQAAALRKIGDLNFGFFGLITPHTSFLASPGPGITFAPVLDSARAAVKDLRERGADVVVALTHLDIAEDRRLAKEVRGIDVILGGHDHDPISFYENGVFILKAGYDAHYLGAVDIVAEKRQTPQGPRISVRPVAWRLVTTAGVAPDPEIALLVKKWEDQLDRDLLVAVGKTEVELDSRRGAVRLRESAIGNLFADATRDVVKAEAAIINGGGIRGDRTYEPGATLTRKDVLTELPFGNLIVLIELSGANLKAALEEGVSAVEDTAGRFPQVAGLSFTFDARLPKLARVLEVKIAGQPLDPAKTYRIATNDYMYGGGDGYASLTKGKAIIDASGAALMASAVMDYIAKLGTVAPRIEGRIVERK